MKKVIWISSVVVLICGLSHPVLADPLAFEPAGNVTGQGGVELGLDFGYSRDFSAHAMSLPIHLRAGLPLLEAEISLPYTIISGIEPYSHDDIQGFGDLGLLLKHGLIPEGDLRLALGLAASLPTGDEAQGLRGGWNFAPFASLDWDLAGLTLFAHASYNFSGEYSLGEAELLDDDFNFVRRELFINPGDSLRVGAGVELTVGEVLALHLDLTATSIANTIWAGNEFEDSGAFILSVLPGISLDLAPFGLEVGVDIPLSDSKSDMVEVYDWMLLAGASWQYSF